eukprot:NODE_4820_length_1014_cov_10.187430_g4614_i0.p1 GENE.NODE_4820_length_1014_cov_10.187430_g4614_i0~~NODE_4820_length_1014_cov_10.187430_g4614_i0.p1  ORF type:complete len:317 (-),score=14.60 NODE_4820_length_1014_cov_10.187430_g4614_i0:43-993(-)
MATELSTCLEAVRNALREGNASAIQSAYVSLGLAYCQEGNYGEAAACYVGLLMHQGNLSKATNYQRRQTHALVDLALAVFTSDYSPEQQQCAVSVLYTLCTAQPPRGAHEVILRSASFPQMLQVLRESVARPTDLTMLLLTLLKSLVEGWQRPGGGSCSMRVGQPHTHQRCEQYIPVAVAVAHMVSDVLSGKAPAGARLFRPCCGVLYELLGCSMTHAMVTGLLAGQPLLAYVRAHVCPTSRLFRPCVELAESFNRDRPQQSSLSSRSVSTVSDIDNTTTYHSVGSLTADAPGLSVFHVVDMPDDASVESYPVSKC